MHLPLRSILVPIDFSDASAAALADAADLALIFGAKLEVLHVVQSSIGAVPELANWDGLSITGEEQVQGVRLAIEQFVADARRKLGAGLTVRVESGSPSDAILARAERADLVVMGTHGRSGLARLFLGSVASSVVRRSSRPVITRQASCESDARREHRSSKEVAE